MQKLRNKYQLSEQFELKEYDLLLTSADYYKNLVSVLLKMISSKKGRIRILEVGAGTGLFTQELIKWFKNARITLVEPDKKCCEVLYKRFHGKVRIIQTEGERFREGKYDVIVMCEAFHHIKYQNKKLILKNFFKLLVTGGFFVTGDLFIPNFKNEKERKIALQKCYMPWIRELETKGDKKQVAMAKKTLELAMAKKGEYHLSPQKFERIIKNAGFMIKKRINTSKTPVEKEGATLAYLMIKV